MKQLWWNKKVWMPAADLSVIGICSWTTDPVLVFQLPEVDLRLSATQTDHGHSHSANENVRDKSNKGNIRDKTRKRSNRSE